MMPEINGWEVLSYQKKTDSIMLLTAKDTEVDKILLEMGADDYVTKPFKLRTQSRGQSSTEEVP